MPELTVGVYDGGTAPSPDEAVTLAAAATSGLFDDCMPSPGASVVGTIAPPDDAAVEPMPVRCEVSVRAFSGFSVVTFLIMAPADATAIPVPEGILGFGEIQYPEGPEGELVVWRFVATEGEALPVASTSSTRTQPADAYTIEYDVSPSGWSVGGSSRCGFEGMGGGAGESAHVTFFDACSPDP
jgi:hypothetical protein